MLHFQIDPNSRLAKISFFRHPHLPTDSLYASSLSRNPDDERYMLPPKKAQKRRLRGTSDHPQKKIKRTHRSIDSLPWKSVKRPLEAGAEGDDGVLELEEIDGVEVVYEETEGGRVARFNIIQNEDEAKEPSQNEDISADEATSPGPSRGASSKPPPTEVEEDEHVLPFDSETLLPEWHAHQLHPTLLRSLHSRNFSKPTPIQSQSIPKALDSRDIVGVAQTGSGKTLAYGLPILHHLLSRARPSSKTRRPTRALILAPTRELALQVSSHLNACLNDFTNSKVDTEDASEAEKPNGKGKQTAKSGQSKEEAASQNAKRKAKRPPHVSIAAIVGGMSSQKQRRILDRGVDVLVATPGRLWDILEEDDELAKDLKHLRFLVLDEADRMIETGHFAELEKILRLTLRENTEEQIPVDTEPNSGDEDEGKGEDMEDAEDEDLDPQDSNKDNLQTFIFSATLSKDLQRNVKKRTRPKIGGKKGLKATSTLDDLLLKLDFRDPDPVVIDLSPQGGVVSTLKESRVECLGGDKDVYLYYFLLRYPGKSLIFLSSIDGIRRLMPLMDLLNLKAFALHSQLEQRQRLKNLDRFANTQNSILISTDVAARGLDIPSVDHVIHYQVPRTADVYVHRNGRTARAGGKGFALVMVEPGERRMLQALMKSLDRDDSATPTLPIDLHLLDKLKNRVQLARRIDQMTHKVKKANHEKKWFEEAAKELEVDLDSDFFSDDGLEQTNPKKRKKKAQDNQVAGLKAELKHLLSQPLVAKGVSMKYITSGSVSIVDDLIKGDFTEGMVGIKKEEAGSRLNQERKHKNKKRKAEKKIKEAEGEEWTGI